MARKEDKAMTYSIFDMMRGYEDLQFSGSEEEKLRLRMEVMKSLARLYAKHCRVRDPAFPQYEEMKSGSQ